MKPRLPDIVELILSMPPGTVIHAEFNDKGEVEEIDGKKVEEDQ